MVGALETVTVHLVACQFNALPTYGTCEAAVGYIIDTGFHGDVRLDGLMAGFTVKFPVRSMRVMANNN